MIESYGFQTEGARITKQKRTLQESFLFCSSEKKRDSKGAPGKSERFRFFSAQARRGIPPPPHHYKTVRNGGFVVLSKTAWQKYAMITYVIVLSVR